jgi:hypothetical protein
MKSPSAEWVLGLSYLGVLDYMRARGEADGDTLSEVVRDLVDRHPAGRVAFTTAYVVGAAALWRHICRRTA